MMNNADKVFLKNLFIYSFIVSFIVMFFVFALLGFVSADPVASSEAVEEYVTPTPRPTMQPIISPLPDLPSDFDSAVVLFEDSASDSLGWAGTIVNSISYHPVYLLICCIPIVILIIALLKRMLK